MCMGGIRFFIRLPPNIKSLSNEVRLFKRPLKIFLLIHFIPWMNILIVILTNIITIPDFTYNNHMF
jgi:hypothetical protein